MKANTTLFTYDPGTNVTTFSNNTFEPMFLDELTFENNTLKSEANAVCNGNINCLFDAASTKDVSMGKSTVEVAIKFEEESKMTSEHYKILDKLAAMCKYQ